MRGTQETEVVIALPFAAVAADALCRRFARVARARVATDGCGTRTGRIGGSIAVLELGNDVAGNHVLSMVMTRL